MSRAAHQPRATHGASPTLEFGGGALGEGAAAAEDGDAVGEPVGLLQVLGGQEDRRTARGEFADHLPQLLAVARVEAGGRFVEEHHAGGAGAADESGGQVEAAAHAARVRPGQPAAGLGEAEAFEEFGGAACGGAVSSTTR